MKGANYHSVIVLKNGSAWKKITGDNNRVVDDIWLFEIDFKCWKGKILLIAEVRMNRVVEPQIREAELAVGDYVPLGYSTDGVYKPWKIMILTAWPHYPHFETVIFREMLKFVNQIIPSSVQESLSLYRHTVIY